MTEMYTDYMSFLYMKFQNNYVNIVLYATVNECAFTVYMHACSQCLCIFIRYYNYIIVRHCLEGSMGFRSPKALIYYPERSEGTKVAEGF